MEIKGFNIKNDEKWNRAIFGTLKSNGEMKGGVGETATDEAKLAEYDKLGGLITKGGKPKEYTVKMGSFYDFKNKKPHEKPKIIFMFRDLGGSVVEVPEGEEIPLEVKAAEISKEKGENKRSESRILSDSGRKKKKGIEDEE